MVASESSDGERPVMGRKVGDVIAGATRVFLERGYATSSMDDVAAAAQVSKRTLYQYYPSKEALFVAVIDSRVKETIRAMDDQASEPRSETISLLGLGSALLERAITDETTRLYQIVIAEAGRLPALGKALTEIGLKAALAEIETLLTRLAKERRVTLEDPAFAADIFLSLLYGVLQVRVLLGASPDEERERAIGSLAPRIAAFERAFGLCESKPSRPRRKLPVADA